MKGFAEKVALITGGSAGIGKAAALAFAREGAKVVLAARHARRGNEVVREIEAAGGQALFVACDVSRADEVRELVRRTVGSYGRLDCAFNNAAAIDVIKMQRTADITEEDFDREMALNMKSVWLCMKFELTQMLAQTPTGGVIVNTSSVNGLGAASMAAPYSAAKSAILALTKAAAQEYASDGIRVNALVPGGFRTPGLEGMFERFSGGNAEAMHAIEQRYAELNPMKRLGDASEAAEAVLWLCSEGASYVTGHSLIVDGGMTAWAR
ncbi:MAG TPA: SDR family oxidoreductase [Clostridia bacterium]|nr:SDR family oxidoreductase [Clostridia bacterium]